MDICWGLGAHANTDDMDRPDLSDTATATTGENDHDSASPGGCCSSTMQLSLRYPRNRRSDPARSVSTVRAETPAPPLQKRNGVSGNHG